MELYHQCINSPGEAITRMLVGNRATGLRLAWPKAPHYVGKLPSIWRTSRQPQRRACRTLS